MKTSRSLILTAGFLVAALSSFQAQTISDGVFTGDLFLQPKTTSPAQAGDLHVAGNLFDLGSALSGSAAYPGLIFTYADDATGSTSALTLNSYRSAVSWKWRQGSGTNQKPKMTLSENNQLSLFDMNGTAQIVLDPNNSQVRINGLALLQPDALGNLGIGSTSPLARLTVRGDGTYALLNLLDGAGTNRFTVLNNGNVGIGSTNPQAKLQVASNLQVQGVGTVNGGNADFAIKTASGNGFWDFATENAAGGRFTIYDAVTNRNPFYLEVGAPTGTLSIKNSGNVGIGTANPSTKLTVIGAIAAFGSGAMANFTNGADQDLQVIVTQGGAGDKYALLSPSTPTNLAFGTGGVEKVRITPAGNVGVGTSTPARKLDVNGSAIVRGSLSVTAGLRVAPQGDVQMGEFTQGPQP